MVARSMRLLAAGVARLLSAAEVTAVTGGLRSIIVGVTVVGRAAGSVVVVDMSGTTRVIVSLDAPSPQVRKRVPRFTDSPAIGKNRRRSRPKPKPKQQLGLFSVR
jgi:hypothetical protein